MSSNSFQSSLRKRTGFTLIEMVIVILIIGILVSIAVPSYLRVRSASNAKVCMTNLRHIEDAKDRWAIDNKKQSDAIPTENELVPNYIKYMPECPEGGVYEMKSIDEVATCTISEHEIF